MILRIIGIMALGMSLGVSAHAGRGIDRAVGQAIWDAAVNGRSTTIGRGNNSMLVIRPTTQGTPSSVTGGAVRVVDTLPVPVGNVTVPITATTNITKDAIVGGVIGVATGGLLGGAIGVAMPLTQAYLNQANARVNPQSGALELANGEITQYGTDAFGWYPSVAAACQGAADYMSAREGAAAYNVRVENGQCKFTIAGSGYEPGLTGRLGPRCESGTWCPSTPQDVREALYVNNPPPAIVDELARYGNIIWPGPTSITGPASVTGPRITTVSSSGNQSTSTVTQTSTPVTYSGSTATAGNPTTTSTSTTTTTNPDGSTSTSTTTNTTTQTNGTEAPAQTPEEASPTDAALPPVPDLYTRKYPNGMEGVWNDYKEQLKGTDLVSLVGKLMPNVGDGGSCPTWPINLDLEQWASYGTHDVAPPCWIWDVAKAILILSALLLARALVFGG